MLDKGIARDDLNIQKEEGWWMEEDLVEIVWTRLREKRETLDMRRPGRYGLDSSGRREAG